MRTFRAFKFISLTAQFHKSLQNYAYYRTAPQTVISEVTPRSLNMAPECLTPEVRNPVRKNPQRNSVFCKFGVHLTLCA
jgi:hypothetical protein